MAGTNLGTAYVQIVPSAQGISGSISNVMSGEASTAGEKTGGLFSRLFSSKVVKGFAIAGAALATGVGIGVSALKKGISETAAYGDHVDKMSQKLGFTTDEFQKWDYVLQRAGTNINSLAPAMKTLSNAAANNSAAFQELGISQEQAAKMSQGELFSATIDKLSQMENQTQRTALASKLLGRGATELGPLLNEGSAAIQEQMDIAEKYGMIMPESAVQASAAFQDSVTTMQMTMTGMKNRMMAEFLPAVTKITDGLGKMFAGDMSGADDVVAGIKDMAAKVAQLAPVVLKAAMQIGKQLLAGILSRSGDIGTQMGTLMGKVIQKVIENAPKILVAAGKLIISLSKGLISQLPSIISAIERIGTAIVTGLGSALWGEISSAASTIRDKFMEPINQIRGKVKSALDKVKNLFPLSVGKIFSNLKVPHINVSGGKAPFGIGGLGTKPSISVSWYARGGVFNNPSLIGVGEAGREIVTPERLMREIVAEGNADTNATLNRILGVLEYIAESDKSIKIDRREFGRLVSEVSYG